MIDLYTKIALSAIALALIAIAAQWNVSVSVAQSGSCGNRLDNPCTVVIMAPAKHSSGWVTCDKAALEGRPCMFVVSKQE